MVTNGTPQRQLRAHMPTRPTPRAAASSEHHAWLASRLTIRDRWLARILHEHRVLTTHQITEIAFPTRRAANHRLRELYQWRVIDRFQPFSNLGSQPMHYVLDTAGATTLAYEDDIDPADLHYRHDRTIGIAHSLRLAHTVGCNTVFTSLIAESRRPRPPGTLTTWWSETRCATHFGDLVRPDGYGRWHDTTTNTNIDWFLEYDYGTEALTILTSKLTGYHRLATASGISTPLLIWLPSTRREVSARRAVTTALGELDQPNLVPIATTATDHPLALPISAAGPRWQPLPPHHPAPTGQRLSLADLAHVWPDSTPPGSPTRSPLTNNAATPPAPNTGLTPPSPIPPQPLRYRTPGTPE